MRPLRVILRDLYVRGLDVLHAPLRGREVDPYHRVISEFNDRVRGTEGPAILEIGSRNVTGVTYRQNYPNHREYVGLDIHPGEGVDVVGDVHRRVSILNPAGLMSLWRFRFLSIFLFPWKVVLEINRVMRVGGLVLLTTHPVWPAHELPWDFWRFPKNGFAGLFNSPTGFEIEQCEEGLPAQGYSLCGDGPTRNLFGIG